MTLKEIAKVANVSPSTVSMVLNNKKGVGEHTKNLITTLLDEHGYTNKPKVEKENKKIRFIKYIKHSYLVNGNAGFVSAIIDSIEKECRLLNYELIISVVSDDSMGELFHTIESQPSDGIILLATEMTHEDIQKFKSIKTPIIVVDNIANNNTFSYVDMDNTGATFELVEHLIELGHIKIGYLHNIFPSTNCTQRLSSFKQAMQASNMKFSDSSIFRLNPTLTGAYESMKEILDNDSIELPTAFLATNDSIAIGAIKALTAKGIRVPEDISIVGFDDLPFSAVSEPPLTTMKVYCENMGKWSIKLLNEKILNNDTTVAKMQIGTKLIVRKSTAQPKDTK